MWNFGFLHEQSTKDDGGGNQWHHGYRHQDCHAALYVCLFNFSYNDHSRTPGTGQARNWRHDDAQPEPEDTAGHATATPVAAKAPPPSTPQATVEEGPAQATVAQATTAEPTSKAAEATSKAAEATSKAEVIRVDDDDDDDEDPRTQLSFQLVT